MTVHDRCTQTTPHGPHRAQYGPWGVKDCPGIPAEPDGPANTEERPDDAARRYATELERLRAGLTARGITHGAPASTPIDEWPVTAALAALDDARRGRTEAVDRALELAAQLEQARTELAATNQLAVLLDEILARFTHYGHPGEPCTRTGWIPTATVDTWRHRVTELRQPVVTAPAAAGPGSPPRAHDAVCPGCGDDIWPGEPVTGGRCAICAVKPATVAPSQGQDPTDEQLLALLRQANDEDGLDVAERELLDHHRTQAYQQVIRAAWRAGHASALGYPVTVGELGDRVVVGDRPDPDPSNVPSLPASMRRRVDFDIEPEPPTQPATEPPTAEQIEQFLATIRSHLAAAHDDDERAEAVEALLTGWYTAWPTTAVTSPHEPLAGELVRLLHRSPCPFCAHWTELQTTAPAAAAHLAAAVDALNTPPTTPAAPIAPNGCDSCSVEPGETHRHPRCPGAARARASLIHFDPPAPAVRIVPVPVDPHTGRPL